MTDMADVQELCRDTIAAGPSDDVGYFADADVIADVGTSKNDIEAALGSRGFVVVVDLPIAGETFHESPVSVHTMVTVPVMLQFNQEINNATTGAGKGVLSAVDKAMSALLEYSATDEADKFTFGERPFELVVNDAGLVAYVLWVKKLCVHSTKN